jgi:ATP-dependent helicase/nuclease subunit A
MDEGPARDRRARIQALDITRSFIVQAPAGSGKTGLLIQRLLALLATVAQPEAIVAMTFTKKAAGEIQERIIHALRCAHGAPEPTEPHDALTWRLARKALERDAAQGWNLLTHPSRLRILTIDALCGALMRQAPLTTKLGASPRMVERPEPMYAQAAQEELAAADAANASWRALLDYLDNDADRVVRLLASMLAKRDQWLRHVVTRDARGLRAALERSLALEIEHELIAVQALFPHASIERLLAFARFAASNLMAFTPPHPLGGFLAARVLPPSTASALTHWQCLADWMLTKSGGFRAKLTAAEGFPAKGRASDPGAEERVARKQGMKQLLLELGRVPGLADALARTRRLPPPTYDDATWDFIAALLDVLPRVAARLRVVFAREGAIDFAEGTLIALLALGLDAPSELLLALDLRIAHLLVDEFQDTSFAQFRLVEGLTAGWEPGDGRTLFLVGDPMQSIYGFREADVGLFVATQHDRQLGSVALEPLVLSQNFRSRPALVEWVNDVFSRVLPVHDDRDRSAVAFKAAAATRAAGPQPAVTLTLIGTPRQEAQAVVTHIESALRAGMQSIAVLVRKRTDLEDILPALRNSAIAFKAVGLDRLAERPALLDLMSLTHALLQPDDRLAWLSTLRAPWCGLTLPDLALLAQQGASTPDIFTREDGADLLPGLSPDGHARLARFLGVFAPALRRRGRTPLTPLVRGTWLALGGPAGVAEPIDLAAADRYFALLALHDHGGDVADWSALRDSLAALHVEPDATVTARVQIMTLHRAKGLEFEVVIMPGLARPPRAKDGELLLWRDRPSGLLLAPLKARTPDADQGLLYTYLRALAADGDAAELGRLLYVGCTRAKEQLHLTACAEVDDGQAQALDWKQPSKGTSLAALWPAIAAQAPAPLTPRPAPAAPAATIGIALRRLSMAWQVPAPPPAISLAPSMDVDDGREGIAFDWARETARQIGIAVHRMLRKIAQQGLERWDRQRVAALAPRMEREFAALGFTAEEAGSAAAVVVEGIMATLADPQGRWLFDPRHVEASSELALTGERAQRLVRIVLDRTFVDAGGTRWIVDFKLSRHEGADREAFLDRECERYRQQLEGYAHIMRGFDQRPVRVGLYFPLLRGWRAWEPAI